MKVKKRIISLALNSTLIEDLVELGDLLIPVQTEL